MFKWEYKGSMGVYNESSIDSSRYLEVIGLSMSAWSIKIITNIL